MTVIPSPELAARLALARAACDDFGRAAGARRAPDWRAWARRLNTALAGLVAVLSASSAPSPSGGLFVAGGDVGLVLGALDDGAAWREAHADYATAAAYRGLSRAVGDDR